MLIGQLKTLVAAYLEKDPVSFIKGTGTSQVDVLLVALNNARRNAERLFNYSHLMAYTGLTLPVAGAQLTDAFLVADDSEVKVKEVLDWYIRASDRDVPIKIMSKKLQTTLALQHSYDGSLPLDKDYRYRGDDDLGAYQGLPKVPYLIKRGNYITVHPLNSGELSLRMNSNLWADDYTDDADEDWFCINGSDYLMWQAIIEVNHLTGSFVAQRDGAIPPPVRQASEALTAMNLCDDASETSASRFERF